MKTYGSKRSILLNFVADSSNKHIFHILYTYVLILLNPKSFILSSTIIQQVNYKMYIPVTQNVLHLLLVNELLVCLNVNTEVKKIILQVITILFCIMG